MIMRALKAVSRVGSGSIHLDYGVGEPSVEGFQTPFDQRLCAINVKRREVIQQVGTVTRIGVNGLRSAASAQELPDAIGPFMCSLPFLFRCRDAGWSNRIDIDINPSDLDNVGIRSSVFRAGLKAIAGTREESWIYLVQRDVDSIGASV
jgi:hypothetical protein